MSRIPPDAFHITIAHNGLESCNHNDDCVFLAMMVVVVPQTTPQTSATNDHPSLKYLPIAKCLVCSSFTGWCTLVRHREETYTLYSQNVPENYQNTC